MDHMSLDYVTGGIDDHYFASLNFRKGFGIEDCQAIDACSQIPDGSFIDLFDEPSIGYIFREH